MNETAVTANKSTATASLTFNGIPITRPADMASRFTAILWGAVGVGKTPLAITAPAPILYLLFDNDGYKSVAHVNNRYDLVDLTTQPVSIVEQFMSNKTDMYRSLEKALATGKYKTLFFDGITSFLERALMHGVDVIAPTVKSGQRPTYIQPQLSGYGARGAYMRMCASTLHELTARYHVNLIFAAHEAIIYEKNEKTGESEPAGYTMMLPGESAVQVPKNISEIWYLREYNGQKRIYVRNWHKYHPIRSRMFTGADFFLWDFDSYNWKGAGIESWMTAYDKNNKLPLVIK